jgi:membrane protein implicated in regulation of membrane protease activity
MSSHKLATLIGALVFLALACASLYRLLVGFPITIAGMQIGQTVSLLVFVSCAALSIMLFRNAMVREHP